MSVSVSLFYSSVCVCVSTMCLCSCIVPSDIVKGCSSSATFEREGDPRRWNRMCRGEEVASRRVIWKPCFGCYDITDMI